MTKLAHFVLLTIIILAWQRERPTLPAPRVAGLLPEPAAAARIRELDDELRRGVLERAALRPAIIIRPLFDEDAA